ncbi:hypothetical protein STTU_5996 [Streptomyces sp. Tu6071]|nr:hypothetical protein STTU_5996 [Streptomyces sp. Tu6071]
MKGPAFVPAVRVGAAGSALYGDSQRRTRRTNKQELVKSKFLRFRRKSRAPSHPHPLGAYVLIRSPFASLNSSSTFSTELSSALVAGVLSPSHPPLRK